MASVGEWIKWSKARSLDQPERLSGTSGSSIAKQTSSRVGRADHQQSLWQAWRTPQPHPGGEANS